MAFIALTSSGTAIVSDGIATGLSGPGPGPGPGSGRTYFDPGLSPQIPIWQPSQGSWINAFGMPVVPSGLQYLDTGFFDTDVDAHIPFWDSGGGSFVNATGQPYTPVAPATVQWLGSFVTFPATPTEISQILYGASGSEIPAWVVPSIGRWYNATGQILLIGLPQTIIPVFNPVTLQKTLNAYLYSQYSDDDDLAAFIRAYNEYTQLYVDWYNKINLPIYTKDIIAGELLDWVGNGIYGFPRPAFSTPPDAVGGYGQIQFAQVVVAGSMTIALPTVYSATDDQYKRSLTWHLYRGDGRQFTVGWFKRRLARWLIGINGTAPNVADTQDISVSISDRSISARLGSGIGTSDNRQFLAAAVSVGAFEMPAQFAFRVTAA